MTVEAELVQNEPSLTSGEQYRMLLEVAEAIAVCPDLNSLFDDLAQRLPRIVPFDFIYLVLHDPARKVMRLNLLVVPEPVAIKPGFELPVEQSPGGLVWKTQQPLVVEEVSQENRFPALKTLMQDNQVRSFCVVPLTTAFRRLGAMGFGSKSRQVWSDAEVNSGIPGLQVFASRPPGLPGGGNFPVEFIIMSTADLETMQEFAQQLQMKAMESGLFYFPPEIDLKYDQPQSEIVIDHEKVAALGLSNAQIGADLASALGGNYVNRFNIAGRSYKVIPQVERAERLNPDQLKDIYVTGPNGGLVPLSTVATIRDDTVPRSLNRFQQMNAIKLSGLTARVDQGLKVLEDAAREILPPGYTINYTGESRQLRTEGGRFLPALGMAILMIFLVLAVQSTRFAIRL